MALKKAFRFAKTVAAGATVSLKRRIHENTTVVRVTCHFPSGSSGLVHVWFYIKTPQENIIHLVQRDEDIPEEGYTASGDLFLSGDNYTHKYDISIPVPANSILVCKVTNGGAIDHFIDAAAEMDDLGGQGRVVSVV